jgi:restriction endonuclease S subunit
MKKNGFTFVSIVETCKIETGVWNPYYYKENHIGYSLSDFAIVQKIENHKQDISLCEFAPIEYKNIPKGELLTFSLEDNNLNEGRYSVIGEQVLLFGTMRAYLGNVLVTPKSEWIGKISPTFYPINSEFVNVIPNDNLMYFWWSYLKSPHFLNQMPTGSGGTRPRISAESLAHTPVSVPAIEVRIEINNLLLDLAQQAWGIFSNCKKIIKNHLITV